ncbi:hypothetical protein P9112_013837 [Eukaryota sp. TZLM1-RC]
MPTDSITLRLQLEHPGLATLQNHLTKITQSSGQDYVAAVNELAEFKDDFLRECTIYKDLILRRQEDLSLLQQQYQATKQRMTELSAERNHRQVRLQNTTAQCQLCIEYQARLGEVNNIPPTEQSKQQADELNSAIDSLKQQCAELNQEIERKMLPFSLVQVLADEMKG